MSEVPFTFFDKCDLPGAKWNLLGLGYRDRVKITIECTGSAAEELLPMLRVFQQMGFMGCSREVIVEDFGLGFFDGDGASRIQKLKAKRIGREESFLKRLLRKWQQYSRKRQRQNSVGKPFVGVEKGYVCENTVFATSEAAKEER